MMEFYGLIMLPITVACIMTSTFAAGLMDWRALSNGRKGLLLGSMIMGLVLVAGTLLAIGSDLPAGLTPLWALGLLALLLGLSYGAGRMGRKWRPTTDH